MLVSPTLRNGFNTTQWNPACPFHATLNPDLPDEPFFFPWQQSLLVSTGSNF